MFYMFFVFNLGFKRGFPLYLLLNIFNKNLKRLKSSVLKNICSQLYIVVKYIELNNYSP